MTSTFALDLKKITEKAKARTDVVVRKVLLDLGASLVLRSPVGNPKLWQSQPPPGHAGGRFRANWQHGFGRAPTGDLPDIDSTGAISLARIKSGVSSSPVAGVHYLVNNLPYSEAIEKGHSTQAPHGVVALTVLEFDGIVSEAAKK